MKTRALFMAMAVLCAIVAYPQSNNPQAPSTGKYLPDTPTAAELFKYISHPVSHATGLVDITIPIYEIKVGDVTLPIYLKYHSSGIKVTEAPNWVGAGWTLVAEPVVSRSAQGLPDERFFNSTLPHSPDQVTEQMIKSNLGYSTYDYAIDNFYYRLPDKSGGFYYPITGRNPNSSPSAVVHPYEPLTINEIFSLEKELDGFKITDEKGLTYLFEGVYEQTYSGSRANRNAWKCTSITSQRMNRSLINFDYTFLPQSRQMSILNDPGEVEFLQNESDLHNLPPNFPQNTYMYHLLTEGLVSSQGNRQLFYHVIPQIPGAVQAVPFTDNSHSLFPEESYWASEQRISRINWGNGNYIQFMATNPTTGAAPLIYRIEVHVGGRVIRTIDLEHSSLRGNLSLLNSLVVRGSDGTVDQRYRLDYFNPGNFPAQQSRNFDYWGYVNTEPATSSIPYQRLEIRPRYFPKWNNKEIYIGQTSRSADLSQALNGTLSSIVYPTGGKVSFTYGLHRFEDPVRGNASGAITQGGGLRIEKIQEFEKETDSSPAIVRTYKYGEGENGLGFCYDFPYIERFRTKSERRHYLTGYYNGYRPTTVWSLSNSPLPYSSGNSFSMPVAYNQVIEYIGDSLRTVYRFNYREGRYAPRDPDDVDRPDFHDERDDWESGQKIEETFYRKQGLTYKPVLRKEYAYETFKARTSDYTYEISPTISRTGLEEPEIRDETQKSDYLIRMSLIRSGCTRPVETRETAYEGNDSVVTVTTNTYEGLKKHMYPSRTTTQYSDGSIVENEYKYPEDNLSLGSEAAAGKSKLLEQKAYGILLEENRKVDGSYVASAGYEYKFFRTLSHFPFLWNVNSGQSPTTRERRTTFTDYTDTGLPLCIEQDEATKAIYVWANYGTEMIAEVKNMELSTFLARISHNTMNTLFTAHCAESNSIYATLTSLRSQTDIHVTSYIYGTSSELLKVIDPSGRTVTYEYDSMNRLKRAKDHEGKVIESYEYNHRNR